MRTTQKSKQPSNLILDLRPVKIGHKRQMSSLFKKRAYNRTLILITGALLLVVLFWFYEAVNKAAPVQDLNTVKSEVGKLMILPMDEQPSLVAVTDKKQIKDSFLAAKTENYDQILIYTKNRVAIIYRPRVNKIVATGDLFADPALVEADGTTIAVYDGIADGNKTKKVVSELEALYPKAIISNAGKTNRQDFPTTIVIDTTNNKDNLVDGIIQSVTSKRGILPLGESLPTTQLMIIIGKD